MNKSDKWIYFGVFIDDESVNTLIKEVEAYIPEEWKIHCHHMTIAFNKKTKDDEIIYEEYKPRFGEKVNLTVTEIGISTDAVAVKVKYDGNIKNDIPHITIATPINGKPVNSNFITKWTKLDNPFNVTGTLNAFMKK